MMNKTNKERKRQLKTTKAQYQLYLEALRNNKCLIEFDIKNQDQIAEVWEGLSKDLNSLCGPNRTPKEWRRIFSDWKCHVRARARKLRHQQNGLVNQDITIFLSDVEEQLLSLINVVDEEVPEESTEIPDFAFVLKQEYGAGTSGSENSEEVSVPSFLEPPQKKKKTVSYLESIIPSEEQKISEYLKELIELKRESLKLKKKKFKLKQMELRLKHPQYYFEVLSEED